MTVPARRQDSERDDDPAVPDEPAAVVTTHETSPGNVVFTERDNTDGWIATDYTVELER